ncbi:hypothetical protein CKO_03576 [Citrobacter koseri ATCC BAA-895]|uniref:Uncharacterized protein n=1 Tax=Citrobacter koseri (strain ATCC BAA-895 / CDC 4225-83 / SGSC4696) TaxID=290338 RepID=A8AME1_CITK8|nr:hypothetical protein CKO_03576 [Citrobacter koseri ATCC BAA-895]
MSGKLVFDAIASLCFHFDDDVIFFSPRCNFVGSHKGMSDASRACRYRDDFLPCHCKTPNNRIAEIIKRNKKGNKRFDGTNCVSPYLLNRV